MRVPNIGEMIRFVGDPEHLSIGNVDTAFTKGGYYTVEEQRDRGNIAVNDPAGTCWIIAPAEYELVAIKRGDEVRFVGDDRYLFDGADHEGALKHDTVYRVMEVCEEYEYDDGDGDERCCPAYQLFDGDTYWWVCDDEIEHWLGIKPGDRVEYFNGGEDNYVREWIGQRATVLEFKPSKLPNRDQVVLKWDDDHDKLASVCAHNVKRIFTDAPEGENTEPKRDPLQSKWVRRIKLWPIS